MKENVLVEMRNTIAKLNQGMGVLYQEIQRLQEVIAQQGGIMHSLPGYEEAVKAFAEGIRKSNEKAEAAKKDVKLDLE